VAFWRTLLVGRIRGGDAAFWHGGREGNGNYGEINDSSNFESLADALHYSPLRPRLLIFYIKKHDLLDLYYHTIFKLLKNANLCSKRRAAMRRVIDEEDEEEEQGQLQADLKEQDLNVALVALEAAEATIVKLSSKFLLTDTRESRWLPTLMALATPRRVEVSGYSSTTPSEGKVTFNVITVLLLCRTTSADFCLLKFTFSSATNSCSSGAAWPSSRQSPGIWRTCSRWKKLASQASKLVAKAR
jgi:hypothetical protein